MWKTPGGNFLLFYIYLCFFKLLLLFLKYFNVSRPHVFLFYKLLKIAGMLFLEAAKCSEGNGNRDCVLLIFSHRWACRY